MKKLIHQCYSKSINTSCSYSFAILVMRVVAGAAFMIHGWPKIQQATMWMGPEAPIPGFLQFLAALSEFGGGIAWIIGLFTPVASFGLLITMIVATLFHVQKGDPFVGQGGSFEVAAIYTAIALVILLGGPGKVSIDALIAKKMGPSP